MADYLSPQDLVNAKVDTKTLGEALNDEKVVKPRYGKSYDSFPLLVRKLLDNGGFRPFPNEQAIKDYVPTVTPSVAKDMSTYKLWLWDKGVWTDTGLSELDRAKEFTENFSLPKSDFFENKNWVEHKYGSALLTIKDSALFNDGRVVGNKDGMISDFIDIKSGDYVEVNAAGSPQGGVICFYAQKNENTFLSSKIGSGVNDLKTYRAYAPKNTSSFRFYTNNKDVLDAFERVDLKIGSLVSAYATPALMSEVKDELNVSLKKDAERTENLFNKDAVNFSGFFGNAGITTSFPKNYFSTELIRVEPGKTYSFYPKNWLDVCRIFDQTESGGLVAVNIVANSNLVTIPENLKNPVIGKSINGNNANYLSSILNSGMILKSNDNASKYIPYFNYSLSDPTLKEFVLDNSGSKPRTSIKILGIGNSFTLDALSYAPWLLQEMGVDDVTIVMAVRSGGTLEQHVNSANNNEAVYSLTLFEPNDTSWTTTHNHTIKEALDFTEFDTIILHQQSARSNQTYLPLLTQLIDYICSNISYTPRFGLMGVPAVPDGKRGGEWSSYSGTSDEFFAQQIEVYKEAFSKSFVEYFLPDGTAIQNARQTSIGALGDFGNMTAEGLHLNEGIPCLTAAYACVMSLREIVGIKGSVLGSKILPTPEWLANKNIYDAQGTARNVTAENALIAQKCAVQAYKFPFEITGI